MQRTKLTNGLLLSGLLLLSSCAQDPIPVSKQETYNRDFIKSFGVFDPNHDWNLAQHSTVTVTTSSPTDIKVYADVKGVRYTFGSFTNVNGTQTLGVDVPASVRELIVRANGRAYTVALEGSVDIQDPLPDNGGTNDNDGTTTPSNGVKLSDGVSDPKNPLKVSYNLNEDTWLTRRGDYVAKYHDILPEGEHSLSSPDVDLNFLFRAEAGQTITIYPAFWNTSATNTLGIYYTNSAGQYIEQDLYTIKTDDVIEKWKVTKDSGDKVWTIQSGEIKPLLPEIGVSEDATSLTPEEWERMKQALIKSGYQFSMFEPQSGLNANYIGRKWEKAPDWIKQNFSLEVEDNTADLTQRYFVFKGFNVTFPESVTFGMYMRTSAYGLTLYSESWRNQINFTLDTTYPYKEVDGKRVYDTEATVEPYKPSFTATFTRDDLSDDSNRRVCFEDWVADNGDFDLNDMVFYVSGIENSEVIIEEDPWVDNYYEWIIATEDLGDNDFDFNDVVFGVHTVKYDAEADKSTIRVRSLASGGTLPVYLYHKDYMDGQEPLKPEDARTAEFHTGWFHGQHTSSTVVNAQSYRVLGKQVEFDVPGEFTMSCQKGVENQNMGGFTVRVDYPHGKEYITAPNLTAEIGEAPQMICVPKEWRWPKERVYILDVYSQFKDWVADQTCNDWHLTPDDESNVWYRNDIPTAPGQGGGNGGGTDTPSIPGTLCTGTIPEQNFAGSGQLVYYTIPEGVITGETTKITLHFSGLDTKISNAQILQGNNWAELGDTRLYPAGATSKDLIISNENNINWLINNRYFYVIMWPVDNATLPSTLNPTVYIEVE